MRSVIQKALLVTLLASAASGTVMANNNDEISILGLDKNGNEIDMPVKSKLFRKKMGELIKVYNSEAIPALDRAVRSDNAFKLREVDLGISLVMGFEVPEVFDFNIEPGVYVKIGN